MAGPPRLAGPTASLHEISADDGAVAGVDEEAHQPDGVGRVAGWLHLGNPREPIRGLGGADPGGIEGRVGPDPLEVELLDGVAGVPAGEPALEVPPAIWRAVSEPIRLAGAAAR